MMLLFTVPKLYPHTKKKPTDTSQGQCYVIFCYYATLFSAVTMNIGVELQNIQCENCFITKGLWELPAP